VRADCTPNMPASPDGARAKLDSQSESPTLREMIS
jgi:hypothetical protein